MSDYHVTLFVAPNCEDCGQAKKFLEKKGIHYEEKSIMDPGARGELRQKTGRTDCPTLMVEEHIVVGYFPQKWDHLLPEDPLRLT